MVREDEDKDGTDPIYKVKVIPYLGRSVPIVLQNDNGPCPLIAISNVLLLRNHVTLSTDTTEISSSKLLQLIATRLLDTNEVDDGKKGTDYELNLQKSMNDAMDLLPRLRTGIDVNLRFRQFVLKPNSKVDRTYQGGLLVSTQPMYPNVLDIPQPGIHDFEFTPECSIFDLFDIGLAHGWLFDHQDKETSEVIGSDTYNTLQEKLVALQASKMAGSSRPTTEEPTVDFAAATTAVLGVPTPMPREMWSSEMSFEEVANEINQEESKQSALDRQRKGDEEEAALLMQALQLSQIKVPHGLEASSVDEGHLSNSDQEPETHLSDHGTFSPMSGTSVGSSGHLITPLEEINMPEEVAEIGAREENSIMHEPGVFTENRSSSPTEVVGDSDQSFMKGVVGEYDYVTPTEPKSSPSIFALGDHVDRPVNPLDVGEDCFGSQNDSVSIDQGLGVDTSLELDVEQSVRTITDKDSTRSIEQAGSLNGASATDLNAEVSSDRVGKETGSASCGLPQQSTPVLSVGPASCSSSRSFGSSGLDDEEPLYEGEDDFANQGGSNQGDNEPLYEGEIILAGQASGSEPDPEQLNGRERDSGSQKQAATVSDREGEIIRRFLEDNASQLTIYGLFSLAENLKDQELCVFFRNNHFSTLFKRNKQLLLLASDQGYLHQPVVWEQLDSVDGDTIFLKGDFTPFTSEEHNNDSWNVQNFMSTHARPDPDSDLQLAMALQQQELDDQQQQQQQQQLLNQQPRPQAPSQSGPSATSLHTSSPRPGGYGPTRASVPAPKPEPKKEKCTIM